MFWALGVVASLAKRHENAGTDFANEREAQEKTAGTYFANEREAIKVCRFGAR